MDGGKSQVTKKKVRLCVFLSGTTTRTTRTAVVVETCFNIDWCLLPGRVSGESTFALFHCLVAGAAAGDRQTEKLEKKKGTARLN